jgi:hemolysin activation/secretion protein
VDSALVRLQVTEAPVERLRVVESRYFSLGEIKAAVPEFAEGHVPHFPQMQDELVALNRSADRQVTPVLRPGKTPGTVEVELKVQDQLPLHGSLEVNDRYSQDTTPTHVSASLRWDNLWASQHSLGMTLQGVPDNPNESRVLSLNYTVPLPSGNVLSLYGIQSDSDVSAVGTLNVIGRGFTAGLRYIQMLPGDERFFQSASYGVDYKDFKQSVNLIGSGGFNTPINYMPFTMGWDATVMGDTSTTKNSVSFNFHAPGLGGSEQEFADKRFKGKVSYSYLRGNASHKHTLGSGANLAARASWQLADQPLISNEQFAIGGVDTVRGYYESAATGETGLAFSLEASTPSFAKYLSDSVNDARLLVFVDRGTVSVLEPITATDHFTLSSVGVGLRVTGPAGLSLTLDWAQALEAIGATRQGDGRLHFKLAYDW